MSHVTCLKELTDRNRDIAICKRSGGLGCVRVGRVEECTLLIDWVVWHRFNHYGAEYAVI